MMRTTHHANNEQEAKHMIVDKNALASCMHACMHATRCAPVNHTMQTSPAGAPFQSSRRNTKQTTKQLIDQNLVRTNKGRINHNYDQIGDHIVVKTYYDLTKLLQERFRGSYPIIQVFTNDEGGGEEGSDNDDDNDDDYLFSSQPTRSKKRPINSNAKLAHLVVLGIRKGTPPNVGPSNATMVKEWFD
eukprot:jgi/Psemu1/39717/gm1.39717_g